MRFIIYGFWIVAAGELLLEFAVLLTGFRRLKLIQDRAHMVLMYGVMVVLDCVVARSHGKAWLEMRAETDREVLEIWNRHSSGGTDEQKIGND